jgi:mono/diheme cytochrome c family protein
MQNSSRFVARCSIVIAAVVVAGCHRSGATSSATPSSGNAARAANAAPALPAGVTLAMVAAGDSLFNNGSCQKCHGKGGIGTALAPNLTDQTWIHVDGSYPAIVSLVTTGFTKAEQKDPQYRFSMNPRGGSKLTDEQVAAVAAYAWSLSHPGAR